ncbi:hypothetical protein QJR52_06150 [Clostridium baratii]|uniref:hypothetical protein n=1 Tax=Clostridium baratii TaxID=1561 RepID=UPI0030D3457C
MNIEEVKKYDLHINGKQAGEIFNLINKIGIKEELKKMFFGDEKIRQLKISYDLKNKEYGEAIQKLILEHMDSKEFKALKKDEQTRFLNKNATEYLLNLQQEVRKLELEINIFSGDTGFDLISVVMDRYYSNQDLFYKVLGSLYKMTEEGVAEQSFSVIVAMLKKIMTCDDMRGIMEVFK